MAVIVTNAKSRIAYNIVRSLGQKGIEVYTSDFVRSSMSFASRYSKGCFLYPSPFREQEKFIDCIIENSRRLNAEVLIPVFEETFLLAKYKDRLSGVVKTILPDYEQILTAHNKDRWEPVARRLNIPTPKTYTVDELRNQPRTLHALPYPVFVKPKQGGGAWGIVEIKSAEQLKSCLNQASFHGFPWARFFIQEKIEGENHCVAMLMGHGKLKAKVVYRQLRDYPVSGGQATLRVSIRSVKAASYFQRLLEHLKWHGVCQADFVVHRRTQIPYLIDINPRFWGSLAQGIASGVDFPHLLYRMATEGDVDAVEEPETQTMSRWIGGDLRTFFPLFKASPNKVRFLRDFLFPGNGEKMVYDDFSLEDPLPFLVWLGDATLRTLKHRSLEPTTHDSLEDVWK